MHFSVITVTNIKGYNKWSLETDLCSYLTKCYGKVLKNNEASLWKADSKMAPGPPRLLLVTLQRSPLPQGTGLACRTNTILQTGMWLLRQVTEGFCFSVLDSWWKPVTTPHSRITKQPWGEVPVEEPRSPVSTDLWDPVSEPPYKSRYTFRWLWPVVTHNYNCIRPPNWTLPELLTRRIAKNNKGVVTVLSSHQILE